MAVRVRMVSWVLLLCVMSQGHGEASTGLDELRAEIEQLRNVTQEQSKELSALKDKLKAAETHRVAFTVSLGSNGIVSTKKSHKRLIYKDELTNIGKAYNTETGVFKVPARGVYYVRYTATASTEGLMGVVLYKNEQVLVTVQEPPSGPGSDTGSNAAVLLLEEGDELYLQLGPNSHLWDNAHRHSTFSGFLLYTM